MLWSGVAQAEGPAEPTPEAAQATDPRQLCLGPASTPDERVKGCSAVIESGQVQGSLLAATYAQRGFVFTLKRNLEQAQKDLDQAIKIAPDYAEAYVNRANFWTVSNQPERAIADAERALKLSFAPAAKPSSANTTRRSPSIPKCCGSIRMPARPSMAVCHEYRRSIRRYATVREMKEDPSRSAIRC